MRLIGVAVVARASRVQILPSGNLEPALAVDLSLPTAVENRDYTR